MDFMYVVGIFIRADNHQCASLATVVRMWHTSVFTLPSSLYQLYLEKPIINAAVSKGLFSGKLIALLFHHEMGLLQRLI